MFSFPDACPHACSPTGCTLPCACLPLSIPASVPAPDHLPLTSQFLSISLTQEGHFFDCLFQDACELSLYCPLIFYFSSFLPKLFLQLFRVVHSSLSLSSLICRGRKGRFSLGSAQWSGLSQSLVLPHLPGFSLPLLSGTLRATHPHLCPPQCCFQGDQDSAWSTLPVHKSLRLAGSQLLTTAILPHSPNRASHSTLLGMLCTSKDINWTFLNSSVV